VGSSIFQKTNVRVITATNVNLLKAVEKGKFREDLYYRLNTVPIYVPPLRERGEDIVLLFRKFTGDFSEKYHVRPISLDSDAQSVLIRYAFPGNIRQLKNIAEQISLLEENREVNAQTLSRYLPADAVRLPMALGSGQYGESQDFSERDLLYKVLFDMKKDMNELKKLVLESYQNGGINSSIMQKHQGLFEELESGFSQKETMDSSPSFQVPLVLDSQKGSSHSNESYEDDVIEDIIHEEDDNSLSLEKKEKEMILKALRKHNNKRKYAAGDLGISERTLYRKIKQYEIE
jgi:DNA-binding NtrC family response regulator